MYPSEIGKISNPEKRRKAYFKTVGENAYFQDTLSNRLSCCVSLTESEAESLYRLLSSRCRQETKARLRTIINFIPNIPNYGIYRRVEFNNGQAHYTAGQDYSAEIPLVRDLLLGRK